MKKLLLAALCAAGFAPLYADNAVKETGVIEAGVIDSRGLFVRDFGVPGTSEDGVMLIQCGADVLPDFQDIEPGVAVICSPFREAELSPAQPKPADCELSWRRRLCCRSRARRKFAGRVAAIPILARPIPLLPWATR